LALFLLVLVGTFCVAPESISAAGGAKPSRIVSLNLCTDQLLLHLVPAPRIAAVTALAQDPRMSATAAAASSLPAHGGSAEEIMTLEPDLILAGTYSAQPTVRLLRQLGYSVERIPVAFSLDEIQANIRAVAAAVGEPERGETLSRGLARRFAALRPGAKKERPLAALYWANGFTSGRGTLASEIVEAAGFRSLGKELGLSGIAPLPMERLLMAAPDALVIGRQQGAPSLATEMLNHRALREAFGEVRRVSVPDHLWTCGTPAVAAAAEHLARFREALPE